jgi:perosamine synthetase
VIWREVPPTAGLPPRLRDLLGPIGAGANLERAVAEFLRLPEVQLECSGTACLLIAFEYLKTRSPRRTVIVPGYTCPLVVLAARQAGLRVLACDLVPSRFDLDLDRIRTLIDDDTLCVLPTHYGAVLTDVARVRSTVEAVSPEIIVIEDAAQAFGAQCQGRPAGTVGHIGFFSFAAGKGFTLFEGGCLVAETAELREGLRATAARIIGSKPAWEFRRAVALAGYHFFYNPPGLSFAYGRAKRSWLARGDDVRAAGDFFADPILLHRVGWWRRGVGVRALQRLEPHLAETRRRFHELLDEIGREVPGVDVHRPAPSAEPTGIFALVTFAEQNQCEQVMRALWPAGLGVSKLFARAIGGYPQLDGMVTPATPRAGDLAARTLALTASTELRPEEFARVIRSIRDCAPKVAPAGLSR